jgi:hypothetical protein
MANTYIAIATTTVGAGGAANIEFTSIPATFTDLCVVISARSVTGSPDQNIQFNNSSANLSSIYFFNVGGSITNGSATSIPLVGVAKSTYTASTFGTTQVYIPNYASSNNKSVSVESVAENNSTSDFFIFLGAGVWSNTAAITSIKLLASGTYEQNSTATLYGIKKN